MKRVSYIFVNSYLTESFNKELLKNEELEFKFIDRSKIIPTIMNVQGKYICFICNNDNVSNNYVDVIYQKSFEEFDCCYINNKVELEGFDHVRRNNYYDYLIKLKPYYLEYIWQYLFKTDILKEILNLECDYSFDENINNIVKKMNAIEEIIYYHNPMFDGNYDSDDDFSLKSTLDDRIPYVDYKGIKKYKNIIYLRDFNAVFSGLVTYITNMGRCFGDEYDLTFVYDYIHPETKDKIEKYFKLVRREKFINYVCDRFVDTYLDFDFPRNFFYTEEASTFIHGLVGEGEAWGPDLYDKYFGVSKACMDTIKLDFDGMDRVDYIHNPIKIDPSLLTPHIRLVSTTRIEKVKGVDRLIKIANILEEENIPFTWNVFTEDIYYDNNTCINSNGFVYRKGIYNPLPYVNDSDYLVMLSDSESFCYSVLEALMLNTKVVVTPLSVFSELGVKDGENGYIIPFEYFDDDKKEKLREKVLEIYSNKDKKMNYKPVKLNFNRYRELFKK